MEPVVRLTGISKIYRAEGAGVYALKDVSLSISKGDFVSVTGPSGSGKTTLLDILGCIATPTSGEYYLDGERVDALDTRELAYIRNRKIGFIFQNFNLIPQYNLIENVELPLMYAGMKRKEKREIVMEILCSVGLGGKEERLPHQLSGGERQRVAIARALVNKPSLLLADEPTGNLDSKTGDEIMNIFKRLHEEGSTIVLITHDKDIAKHALRSYCIRDGELAVHQATAWISRKP